MLSRYLVGKLSVRTPFNYWEGKEKISPILYEEVLCYEGKELYHQLRIISSGGL
jgi:hypothetical protein